MIAVTAFIGSIFGAGGGGEASNSDLLAKLKRELGPVRGHRAWDDVMLSDDPEAPTTIKKRFNYPPLTGGKVSGSVIIDPGSVKAFDPLAGSTAPPTGGERRGGPPPRGVQLPGRVPGPVGHRTTRSP